MGTHLVQLALAVQLAQFLFLGCAKAHFAFVACRTAITLHCRAPRCNCVTGALRQSYVPEQIRTLLIRGKSGSTESSNAGVGAPKACAMSWS